MKGYALQMLLAPLTAGLLWLAFPGGGEFWPLVAFALVPFLLLVMGAQRGRQAAVYGLLIGLVHFLIVLYWLVTVLGYYGGLPPYFSVPALVLLALYMGLYWGVCAFAARLFWIRLPLPLALWLIPCFWVGLDWCRSFLFSGFPWMDLGYVLANVPWLLQSADVWGHYGLSFVVILINTLLAALLFKGSEESKPRNSRMRMILPVIVLCCGVSIYSFWRWQQIEAQIQAGERILVGVVQGNIPQDQKWSPALQAQTVDTYCRQSRGLIEQNRPALLVWPETALPFYPMGLFPHPLLQSVVNLTSLGETPLLTGAPEQRTGKSPQGTAEKKDADRIYYFNSALLFDTGGQISDRYSKSHLVPFGEYVPLKKILPFLAPVVEAVGDFSPGVISHPLACQKARIGVLICFESIFPEIARKWAGVKANLLINLTNDAWYGRSSAPHHSLAMTVLRAVETRRSLVRAANTGFSGFIDPLGRKQLVSPLFVQWAAASEVVLMEEETCFVHWGYLFAPWCLAVALLSCLWIGLYNPRHNRFS